MASVNIALPDETKAALDRTVKFLRAQAQWLEQTGSRHTLPSVETYAQTLERLAAAPVATPTAITGEEREHLQQAAFLLEGARNSFRNANFTDRAAKVSTDIARLYDIVKDYNAAAGA
jgi:hypothetical protein